jgi:hypothetical protein
MTSSLTFRKKRELDVLLLVFFFAIPFFNKFETAILSGIFFFSIVESISKKRISIGFLFWFLPALFLYYAISELSTGGTIRDLEMRLYLVLIPLMVFLNPEFQRANNRAGIYRSYILGNLIAMTYCICRAFVRSISVDNGQWTFNAKVLRDTDYDFLTSSVMGGNYFFGEDLSLFHHPTYAGVFIVFAQYLAFEIFDTAQSGRTRRLMVFCYIFFLGALFLLSSKAAILTSLLMSFWIFFRLKIRKPVKISIVAVFAIVSVLFLFFNPRLKVFKDTLKTKDLIDPNARYGYDLRILSWDASLTLISEHWLVGVGEAKKKTALAEVYKSRRYVVPAEKFHNSHNLYLDFMIGGGLLALTLFLAGMGNLFVMGWKQKNVALLVFLLIFCFNGLFENLLSRQSGLLFFAAFITLLASKERLTANQSPKD